MYDNQKTFDLIWKGLEAQDWQKSRDQKYGNTACAYRGEGGRKCAAGILIPDELYKKEFEGWTVSSLYYDMKDDQSIVLYRMMQDLGHDPAFVSICQSTHDNDAEDALPMKDSFIALAKECGLVIPA